MGWTSIGLAARMPNKSFCPPALGSAWTSSSSVLCSTPLAVGGFFGFRILPVSENLVGVARYSSGGIADNADEVGHGFTSSA